MSDICVLVTTFHDAAAGNLLAQPIERVFSILVGIAVIKVPLFCGFLITFFWLADSNRFVGKWTFRIAFVLASHTNLNKGLSPVAHLNLV